MGDEALSADNLNNGLPEVIVVHDGELADVCGMIRLLGVTFAERHGSITGDDRSHAWDLVVATPKRILEITRRADATGPVRLAIVDNASRTAMSMLKRARVDLTVQRPVHPTALRLLLLHALYRGPEKRKRRRVSVGAPVRFRGRLRRRPAILADLSARGCRMLSKHAAKRDSAITVLLPATVTGARALSLSGRVVRTGPASGEDSGTQAIAVVFDPPSKKTSVCINDTLKRFANGPATLDAPIECLTEVAEEVTPSACDRSEHASASSGTDANPAAIVEAPAAAVETEDASGSGGQTEAERRRDARHQYPNRVIALSDQATRVLIGRDISLGGMRVDPNDSVGVGDQLQIALHIRTRTEPLVVSARVDRDDGEAGLMVRFEDLSESASEYLKKMVNYLPILTARLDDDEESGVIVSEILEQAPAGVAAEA